MYYVYLIQSMQFPEITYVGYTIDLETRIKTHNHGGSIHTAKYKPWKLVMYLAFSEERVAKEFEQYLKSHSGRAFMQKRFLCAASPA